MSDPVENGEGLPAFGRWLARERELRGLGRDEVSRVMKLAPTVVETLESGDESRMPPRAYAVGWLRAYASAVGLDADEVVLRFDEAVGGPARGPGPHPPTDSRGRIVLAVLLAAAIAGAGVWALLR